MNRTKTLLFAIGIGGILETVFCGVGVVSIFAGGIGPCGPSGDFPGWLVFVHQPGIWVAEVLLPNGAFSLLPIIVLTTGALLSAIAYGILSFSAKSRARAAQSNTGPSPEL